MALQCARLIFTCTNRTLRLAGAGGRSCGGVGGKAHRLRTGMEAELQVGLLRGSWLPGHAWVAQSCCSCCSLRPSAKPSPDRGPGFRKTRRKSRASGRPANRRNQPLTLSSDARLMLEVGRCSRPAPRALLLSRSSPGGPALGWKAVSPPDRPSCRLLVMLPWPLPPASAVASSAEAASSAASAAAAAAAASAVDPRVPCRLRVASCVADMEWRCSLVGADRQPAG